MNIQVLDMCAAPGSKTSQLLESLHDRESKTGELPTGMIVANDIDIKRAYMLVHQVQFYPLLSILKRLKYVYHRQNV